MKVYLVKTVSMATENNPTFSGMEYISYSGKGEKTIATWGSAAEAMHSTKEMTRYDALEYGYKRKCDAVRSWMYKNPENSEYWKSVTSIEEMEI